TGQTVDVTVPIALASGTTLTIAYGDTGSSSAGAATAPSAANAGNSIFTLKSKSTSGGTVTTLATTPSKTAAVSNGGDTSGSSSGAAAATHAADSGPATWTVQEKSTSGGALTSLTSGSPSVTVNPSSDGSGTASINPTTATAGSAANTEVLTYTVATGGIATSGAIKLGVPANWTAPQTSTPSAAGYVQVSVNGGAYATTNVTASGQTITFTATTGLD